MISYRQADLVERVEKSKPHTMIVDMLHTSGGMTVIDNVYEKDHDYTLFADRKRLYLKAAIRKMMEDMGIFMNKRQNHTMQQGFNNINAIMKKLKEDPRIESITENFTDEDLKHGIQHFLYTVVMK